MNTLKYVRFNREIIMFPDHVDHGNMVTVLTNGLYRKEDLVSAGFISVTRECNPNFKNPGFKCHGRSIKLNLPSLPEDSEIANIQMYGSSYES